MGVQPPTDISPQLITRPQALSLHQYMCDDDHAELHCYKTLEDITQLITLVMEMQHDWGLATHMDKYVALTNIHGKGGRHQLTQQAHKFNHNNIQRIDHNNKLDNIHGNHA